MKQGYVILATVALLLAAWQAQAAFGRWFSSDMTGSQEVPPVVTDASGRISVKFNREETAADFRLRVNDGEAITQAHLHCAPAGENGPVVVHLFGNIPGGFDVDGELADFTITEANIVQDVGCDPDINTMADLAQAARDGEIYANVHSVDHPGGEIRGQLHE